MANKYIMKPIIKTEKLSVIYFLGKSNQVNALLDVDLEIYPGEFIIFFGPSGCGKSTLLYGIAGLEKNISGNVFIDGENLSEFSEWQIEKYHQTKIGMIFQAYYLINSLNVLKNVTLPQLSIGAKIFDREKRAMELMEHFGVKPQAYKFPNELSGGQQQRVAICRALVNDPDIIYADEPTGNLDSKSANDVMGLLANLNEKQKKTVILVTHSPAHLEYAHRVFYMKDGVVTNIKVNRQIKDEHGLTISVDDLSGKGGAKADKGVDLLTKTYSSFDSKNLGNLLIPYKAKQIVAEALSGRTVEEINEIEKKVQHILRGSVEGADDLEDYFDKSFNQGGLDMNKRTAKKLADGIMMIIEELKQFQKDEEAIKRRARPEINDEIRKIRHYLLDDLDINLKNVQSVERINEIINDRLNSEIDQLEVRVRLDLPLAAGGAGLDRRFVNKIARRLELLLLARY